MCFGVDLGESGVFSSSLACRGRVGLRCLLVGLDRCFSSAGTTEAYALAFDCAQVLFYSLAVVLAGLWPGMWPRRPLAGGPPSATVAMKLLEWTEGACPAEAWHLESLLIHTHCRTECGKLGWTYEQQDLCSEVLSHEIVITKPPGPFWLMAWSVSVELHNK